MKKCHCKQKCICCSDGKEAYERREKELMDEYGWLIHSVCNDGGGVDFHTHGLTEKLGMELQILTPFPLPAEIGQNLLWGAVEKFSVLELDKPVSGIAKNFDVMFVKVSGCNVARMILPDKDGNLHFNSLDGVFRRQYEGVENEHN